MLIKWEKTFLVFGVSVCFLPICLGCCHFLPPFDIYTYIYILDFCFRCRASAPLLCISFPDSKAFFHHSFLYDGARINDDDTPDSFDMEDNGEFLSLTHSQSFCNFVSLILTPWTDTID